MSFSNISTTTLKGLVKLVERRDAVKAELARVESQISATLQGKLTPSRSASAPKTKARRGKHGALKEAILATLKAAGKAGTTVKELSSKLGVKNQNLHVWFHTTGKKIKGLKKVGTGAWALSS